MISCDMKLFCSTILVTALCTASLTHAQVMKGPLLEIQRIKRTLMRSSQIGSGIWCRVSGEVAQA